MEQELYKVIYKTREVDSHYQKEKKKVEELERHHQKKEKEVCALKAKNRIDLLDFHIEVIPQYPDDWDEMERIIGLNKQHEERLAKYERSETKLITEVKQLRSKLEEVTKRNEVFRKKVQKLMEHNNKITEENNKLKAKEEADTKTMIALKKECAELNGQMGGRIDQIRTLMARNE